jgi:xanthine dehydrogenase small subunit
MKIGSTLQPLTFLLNGRSISVEHAGPHTTLLDVIRDQGLTGAKEGCAEGECGACMVLLVADREGGCGYRAVNSCLMLAPMAAGHEIYTVEALATNGQLAPVQEAMASAGGSQCGYCTPGFVVSLFAEHYRTDRTGPCDPHALAGNLCRCTGYRPIRDAVLSLGDAPQGTFRDRLSLPAPQVKDFEYQAGDTVFHRPITLDRCFSLAAEDPDLCWVSGATDLAVESNLRFRHRPHLVSVEAIPELLEFSDGTNAVRIGAGLSLTEIGLRWSKPPELFRQWLPLFASPAIRNRATLGGNLATASPIGDGAPMLMALDASVHLAGPRGPRQIPLTAFFTGYRSSVLEPGELIVTVEIPKPFPAFTRFYKVAKRRMDDISTVAAGLALDLDQAGRVARARVCLGGVAAVPLRVYAAEEAMLGERWNEAAVQHVQSVLDGALRPLSDHRGSADYRRDVAQALIEKFWWERKDAAA